VPKIPQAALRNPDLEPACKAPPAPWRATIRSAALADIQQQRLLERLRHAGEQPVAFSELHAAGIDFPAAVVPELELHGYAIEHVNDHGRVVGRWRRVGPWRRG
jgi:hypothetical protein